MGRCFALATVSIVSLSSAAHSASVTECRDALVVSTFNKIENRFRDQRLATFVSKEAYDKAKAGASGQATIYGIPMGASYEEFKDRASKYAESYSSSLTESEAVNVMWSGISPSTVSAYSACLNATTKQRGLQAEITGATATDIVISLHYSPQGSDPNRMLISWQPSVIRGARLPKYIVPGQAGVRFPRPRREMQVIVNGIGTSANFVLAPLPVIPLRVPTVVNIPSRDYRGDASSGVSVGGLPGYGPDTMTNGPPHHVPRPNAAEWRFDVPVAGSYFLEVEYAAASARPVNIDVNGARAKSAALAEATGCWEIRCQKWSREARIKLNQGQNVVRLQRDDVFPHIRTLRFVPE